MDIVIPNVNICAMPNLKVLKVYEEEDGSPVTFTAEGQNGELLLVRYLGLSLGIPGHFAAQITDEILQDAIEGKIDLKTALTQPKSWMVKLREDMTTQWMVECSIHRVPSYRFGNIGMLTDHCSR
jgi:hypothetical protein